MSQNEDFKDTKFINIDEIIDSVNYYKDMMEEEDEFNFAEITQIEELSIGELTAYSVEIGRPYRLLDHYVMVTTLNDTKPHFLKLIQNKNGSMEVYEGRRKFDSRETEELMFFTTYSYSFETADKFPLEAFLKKAGDVLDTYNYRSYTRGLDKLELEERFDEAQVFGKEFYFWVLKKQIHKLFQELAGAKEYFLASVLFLSIWMNYVSSEDIDEEDNIEYCLEFFQGEFMEKMLPTLQKCYNRATSLEREKMYEWGWNTLESLPESPAALISKKFIILFFALFKDKECLEMMEEDVKYKIDGLMDSSDFFDRVYRSDLMTLQLHTWEKEGKNASEITRYCHEYYEIPESRLYLANRHAVEGDTDLALKVCEDSKLYDMDDAFNLAGFSKLRLETFRALDLEEEEIQELLWRLKNIYQPNMEDFSRLKKLIGSSEEIQQYALELIDEKVCSDIRCDLIFESKDTDQIMNLVKELQEDDLPYYLDKMLVDDPKNSMNLWEDEVLRRLELTKTRKKYKEILKLVAYLMHEADKRGLGDLIAVIKKSFPKRKALLEEVDALFEDPQKLSEAYEEFKFNVYTSNLYHLQHMDPFKTDMMYFMMRNLMSYSQYSKEELEDFYQWVDEMLHNEK